MLKPGGHVVVEYTDPMNLFIWNMFPPVAKCINCIFHCRFQNKEVADHKCYDDSETWQQRAILVALGLVYYFRLNKEFREEYKASMEQICGDITFTDALDDEV